MSNFKVTQKILVNITRFLVGAQAIGLNLLVQEKETAETAVTPPVMPDSFAPTANSETSHCAGSAPNVVVEPCCKSTQRIYFANHTSHLDSVALWSALPAHLRARTRPVAALDYWGKGGFRRFLSQHGFNAVYVDRHAPTGTDPLEPLINALTQGDSLIIFPEGTRGTETLPADFKSGLYRLATQFPDVDLVPVYMDTLRRSMPKGCFLPIPLNCTVQFGPAIKIEPGEDKAVFLTRARDHMCKLAQIERWG